MNESHNRSWAREERQFLCQIAAKWERAGKMNKVGMRHLTPARYGKEDSSRGKTHTPLVFIESATSLWGLFYFESCTAQGLLIMMINSGKAWITSYRGCWCVCVAEHISEAACIAVACFHNTWEQLRLWILLISAVPTFFLCSSHDAAPMSQTINKTTPILMALPNAFATHTTRANLRGKQAPAPPDVQPNRELIQKQRFLKYSGQFWSCWVENRFEF